MDIDTGPPTEDQTNGRRDSVQRGRLLSTASSEDGRRDSDREQRGAHGRLLSTASEDERRNSVQRGAHDRLLSTASSEDERRDSVQRGAHGRLLSMEDGRRDSVQRGAHGRLLSTASSEDGRRDIVQPGAHGRLLSTASSEDGRRSGVQRGARGRLISITPSLASSDSVQRGAHGRLLSTASSEGGSVQRGARGRLISITPSLVSSDGSRQLSIVPSPTLVAAAPPLRRSFRLRPKTGRTTIKGKKHSRQQQEDATNHEQDGGPIAFSDDDDESSPVLNSFQNRLTRKFRRSRRSKTKAEDPRQESVLTQQGNVAETEEDESGYGNKALEEETVDPDDEFKFLPPGEEPTLDRRFQERAVKAITAASLQTFEQLQAEEEGEEEEEELPVRKATCCEPCLECYRPIEQAQEDLERRVLAKVSKRTKHSNQYIQHLTPQLKKASSMGFGMMKKVLFPAMPRFLQDLWVFLEFGVTVLSFILALTGLNLSENIALNVVTLILSIVGMVLALIDAYIYFFQMSNLSRCCASCFSKMKAFCNKSELTSHSDEGEDKKETEQRGLAKEKEQEVASVFSQNVNGISEESSPVVLQGDEGEDEGETEQEETTEGTRRKWWQLSDNVKEVLDTWFEVIRTVISEFILYPTLVCDLLDFVSGVSEVAVNLREDPTTRLHFSLFLLGNLYTIIAVYFMRLLIVVGAFISIRRLPTLPSQSSGGYLAIIGRFCLHILFQIICHAMIALALSAKIHQENQGDHETVRVSPFLWITIITGGILPLAGIAVFFLTNYYWMRQFSISFWLDMVSLLQGESFAEVVFGGDSVNIAKEKSLTLADKTEYSVVKKQFRLYQNTPFWIKATKPLRVPLLLFFGLLYDFVLIAFMASMVFSTDAETGDVRFVLFDTDFLTSMFFIMLVCLLVANFHVLVIINLWLVVAIIVVLLLGIVGIPFAVVFVLPYALCGTCIHSILPKIF